MFLLVTSTSALALLITLVCFRETISRETVKKKRLKAFGGRPAYLDEELEKSFFQRYFASILKKSAGIFASISKRGFKPSAKKTERNTKMVRELRLAGVRMPVQEYLFLRIIVAVVILGVGAVAAVLLGPEPQLQMLIVLVALTLAILLPKLVLRSRIRSRQRDIQHQLPSVMDVLSVSMEAGLSFDASLLKATERFKGPLIEELSQVYREVQMGKQRREALASLNQRTNVPELQTFASAVVQSEQFGTPMKNVLRVQAQQLRMNRRQQAQEKGMKAPVRMMPPMVIFIFPVIFIILLGPTVIKVLQ